MNPSSAARSSDPGLSIPAALEAEPIEQAAHEAGRSLWRRTAGYGRKVAPLALSHGLSRMSAFAFAPAAQRFQMLIAKGLIGRHQGRADSHPWQGDSRMLERGASIAERETNGKAGPS
jgi:hypothetical protein